MARKKKSNGLVVNFKDVEARVLIPEGDYRVKVLECEKEDGNEFPYLAWTLEIVDEGPYEGKKLYNNTSLSPAALWNLRTFLEAFGVEVPDDEYELNPAELCGIDAEAVAGVTVEHEKYEGKPKARVVDVFGVEDEEEEEDTKKKSSKKKSSKDDEEDEEDEDGDKPTRDEVLNMDEDELEECIDEHDLDVDLDDHKKLKDKRKAVADALEASANDDDDEDEKVSADEVNEMGAKELAALVKKHGLDEPTGSTKAKRRAIIKALEEEGLLKS